MELRINGEIYEVDIPDNMNLVWVIRDSIGLTGTKYGCDMVTNENFHQYPLITMRDTPSIEVITINSSDTPTGGLGESVIGTIPAAMSSAIFDLTGQRLRVLPLQLA